MLQTEEIIKSFDGLDLSQKQKLAHILISQIAEQELSVGFELSDAQKAELDEAYKEALANPFEGSSWEEVKAKIINDR